VGLALIFVVLAVLYGAGAIQILTRTGSGRHFTHAVVMAALAVGTVILARFAWPQRSA